MRTNDLGTDAADVQPHDVEQVAGKLSDSMIEKPLAYADRRRQNLSDATQDRDPDDH